MGFDQTFSDSGSPYQKLASLVSGVRRETFELRLGMVETPDWRLGEHRGAGAHRRCIRSIASTKCCPGLSPINCGQRKPYTIGVQSPTR
ncbi:hypothetical protein, partial [Achromobacter sp. K91]|uniref:hypothetical protein n=1 Tax=Achromobacter sp. K91 TaxID=2292262 RepID=UPI001F40F081